MDPLVCTRCGQPMSIVAFVTDSFAIRRDASSTTSASAPQQQEKPPPIRELLRMPEGGEGRGVPAEWE